TVAAHAEGPGAGAGERGGNLVHGAGGRPVQAGSPIGGRHRLRDRGVHVPVVGAVRGVRDGDGGVGGVDLHGLGVRIGIAGQVGDRTGHVVGTVAGDAEGPGAGTGQRGGNLVHGAGGRPVQAGSPIGGRDRLRDRGVHVPAVGAVGGVRD